MVTHDTASATSKSAAAIATAAAHSVERRHLLEHESVIAAQRKLEALGYPIKIGGRWSSGLPFLDQGIKGGQAAWETGIQLPLTTVNISELQVSA